MPTINWPVIISGLAYALLTGVFNAIFAHKSQINEWAEANPRLAGLMKITRAIGLDPAHLWAAGALIVKGRLPKVQTDPVDDKLDDTQHFGPPLLVLLFVSLCLSQQACVGHRVDWPRVLQCAAPLEQPLLQTVASVLAGTGDVKTELEQVALDHGAGVVECAVQQLVNDMASGPATARASHAAARGRAFLVSVQR